MSHWNHRVIKHVDKLTNEQFYTIEECYYNEGCEDIPHGHTTGLSLFGETIDELRETLNRMLRCLDAPVLDENDTNKMDEDEFNDLDTLDSYKCDVEEIINSLNDKEEKNK